MAAPQPPSSNLTDDAKQPGANSPSSDTDQLPSKFDPEQQQRTGDDDHHGDRKQENPPSFFNSNLFCRVNNLIQNGREDELLLIDESDPKQSPVNLMQDPVLSVVIACRKTVLAVRLIEKMSVTRLENRNYFGDTALHVAAAMNDHRVVRALVLRDPNIVDLLNKKQETALHKAALNGHRDLFWWLVSKGSSVEFRRNDGANVLHCAIMGNAPELALEIAKEYEILITSRSVNAGTPLQLMVTIPDLFRSKLVLGSLDKLIYDFIPLDVNEHSVGKHQGDEEGAPARPNTHVVHHDDQLWARIREEFPTSYATILDFVELITIPAARWTRTIILNILRPVFPRIKCLEEIKNRHKEAMELTAYLAQPNFVEFHQCGKKPDTISNMIDDEKQQGDKSGKKDKELIMRWIEHLLILGAQMGFDDFVQKIHDEKQQGDKSGKKDKELIMRWIEHLLILGAQMGLDDFVQKIHDEKQQGDKSGEKVTKKIMRWEEPPLILGAQMGLDDFVRKMLQVCPQSVAYLDSNNRSVVEVAIESGSRKIVHIIHKMTQGDNPTLPSWLFSGFHQDSTDTILHLASANCQVHEDDAVQMQDEIKWFEKVTKMIPKELVYSRNKEERTAQEIFTESHKEMLNSCKFQLKEMGKTCSGLVAAVVFASSFSIPGEKDDKSGNPVYFHRIPFKIFSHAYVIGLSCAATSLVLFLSLIISSYKEKHFRRAIPTKYYFARLSFSISLMAFLLSFVCDIFLQIYGGKKTETKVIISMIMELITFPIVCFSVLVYRDSNFFPSFTRLSKSVITSHGTYMSK